MGTLTLFSFAKTAPFKAAQDGAAGDGATDAVAAMEPFLTGANDALWVGFGTFIAIFLIVMIAIIRARVIKPAQRAARDTSFFEPAGANAEITFDEPAQPSVDVKKREKKDRKKKSDRKSERKGLDREAPTEIAAKDEMIELTDADAAEAPEAPSPKEESAPIAAAALELTLEESPKPEQARSPFAGIFDKRGDVKVQDADDARPASDNDPYALQAPQDVRMDHLPEVDEDYWAADRARAEEDVYARAEDDRRLALEEAARAREAAAAAEAAVERRRHEASEEAARLKEEVRAVATEREKAQAALQHSLSAVSDMQSRLDEAAGRMSTDAAQAQSRIGASLNERFDQLSEELHQRLASAAAEFDDQYRHAESAGMGAAAAGVAASLARLEKSTEAALAGLAERIDALSARQSIDAPEPEELRRLNRLLAERAAPAVAGMLQLSALVRSALPADRFAFDRLLKSGAKSDCLILRPDAAPFAIDARYPVEAFDRYARADDKAREHAATAYRRAILRHMIFVAEKLIVADETADFAILFTPSDTIFNDLHRNFADVVQDSYRARIWIASPTSLMATLHMMNAADRFHEDAEADAGQLLKTAVARLSERVENLEARLAQDAAEHRPAPTIKTPTEFQAFDEDDAGESETALAADDDALEEADVEIVSAYAPDDEDQDAPFPLR